MVVDRSLPGCLCCSGVDEETEPAMERSATAVARPEDVLACIESIKIFILPRLQHARVGTRRCWCPEHVEGYPYLPIAILASLIATTAFLVQVFSSPNISSSSFLLCVEIRDLFIVLVYHILFAALHKSSVVHNLGDNDTTEYLQIDRTYRQNPVEGLG